LAEKIDNVHAAVTRRQFGVWVGGNGKSDRKITSKTTSPNRFGQEIEIGTPGDILNPEVGRSGKGIPVQPDVEPLLGHEALPRQTTSVHRAAVVRT
jgi:hypothetical protein